MVTVVLRPLRFFAQALMANDSPRQTAWGFTGGMIVGLLPKGNLLAIVLAMLLYGLRVNVAATLLGVGVFSYVGWALDDFAHRIGSLILTWESARPAFAWLFDLPLGPYIGFNNTVVMGQLAIALYLAYPTYKLAKAAAVHIQPRILKWLLRYRVIRWLRGVELGAQWGLEG